MTATAGLTGMWPQPDGTPIACREKLRVLAENQVELQAMLRDVFDDAVLMGVDQAAMRQILIDAVLALPGPLWPKTAS